MSISPEDFFKNYKRIKHFLEPFRNFIHANIKIIGEENLSENSRRKVKFVPQGTVEIWKIKFALKILEEGVRPDGVNKILSKKEIDQLKRKASDALNAKSE
jgi:hypothetical protein